MCERYGADTFRLYEMSHGPAGVSRPWETRAVVGSQRFLQRVWRIWSTRRPASCPGRPTAEPDEATPARAAPDHRRRPRRHGRAAVQHRDRQADRAEQPPDQAARPAPVPRAVAEPLVLMLAPLAPHMAEELWSRLGHAESLAYEPFPVADRAVLVAETVEYPVQVNGKVRARVDGAGRRRPEADRGGRAGRREGRRRAGRAGPAQGDRGARPAGQRRGLGQDQVRLATWNVNSVTARVPRLVSLAGQRRAGRGVPAGDEARDDAFADCSTRRWPRAATRSPRYGDGRWNGVALLSRVGLTDVTRGPARRAAATPRRPRRPAPSGDLRGRAGVVGLRPQRTRARRHALRLQAGLADRVAGHRRPPGRGRLGGLWRLQRRPSRRRRLGPVRLRGGPPTSLCRSATRRAGLLPRAGRRRPTPLAGTTVFTYWDYRAGMFHQTMGMRIDLVLAEPGCRDGSPRRGSTGSPARASGP